jgi:hypothetical protein
VIYLIFESIVDVEFAIMININRSLDETSLVASEFLHGCKLSTTIRKILMEPGAKAAVAFWGNGSQDWVTDKNVKVIANLMMGGTNPYAFEKVSAKKRKCNTLHAKVYIGAEWTVACSANASVNGLALEGTAQAGWIEAGVLCRTTKEIVNWFEGLWNGPEAKITKNDWNQAKALWDLRRSSFVPSLEDFERFDPDATYLPAFTWVSGNDQWDVNTEALDAQGLVGPEAKRRVDEGLWVRHLDDVKHLSNRWVLVVTKLKKGGVGRSPWFIQMSDVFVRGGFSWADGEAQDVLLSADRTYPGPFNPQGRRFISAMNAVLARAEFADLLGDDLEGQPWFEPRHDLTRRFWKALRAEYDALGHRQFDPI